MTDSWITVHCQVREADVDKVETSLEEAGAQAVTCVPADGQALRVDELTGATPLWPVCDVSGLFALDTDVAQIEMQLSALAISPMRVWTTRLAAQAWHESWRDQFTLQRYGRDLWVCPTWLEPPSQARQVVRIDPGMAFGTGNHETTAMCLDWLTDSESIAGARVLDYGCGSGILAIAVAKLGAREVVAVDIDPAALEVSAANAKQNSVVNISFASPTTMSQKAYDLVVANILLEPLVQLAPQFARLLDAGGRIVLSGILVEQIDDILAAYAGTFKIDTKMERGEWGLVAGVRLSHWRSQRANAMSEL